MNIDQITAMVRAIQSLLASRNEPVEAELVDLASQHEEFVNTASRRLENVEQLLSKGLRSEALEQAEADPNLNDVLTTLDFPELAPWNELLESKGIQPVPGISVEAAAELNDAYLASGSIEKLLQHYRSISLARAPLPRRIAALRKLAERDDQNPAWRLDLTEFEQHRLKEMRTELETAVRAEDLTTVAQLDQELSGDGWTVNVPAAIRQQARKFHEGMRRKAAKAELETLSHQLSDAYAEFNRPLARRLQQRFSAVQGIAGIETNHPLLDIAGPALDWLVEESRKDADDIEHTTAVAEIETVLDRKTSVDELEKLYHRATRYGHSLPELLETRLIERRDLLRGNTRRKRALIGTISVLVCLGIVIAVTLMIQKMSFNKSVAGHDEELHKLIASAKSTGQIAPVDDYLKSVNSNSPAMLQTPVLMARIQELESLKQSESGRLSQMRHLKSAIQKVAESGSRLEEFPAAVDSLTQLQPLIKGESEKSDLIALEQSLADRRASVQKSVDEAFGAELNKISDDIPNLPQDSLTGYDSVFARLTTLAARRDVSEPLMQSVLALQSKVQQDRQMVASNMKTAAGLQKITDSVGQLASYEQNMQQYVRDNPGTERAKSFETLLNSETTIWKSAATWNLLRRRLKLVEPNRISPAEAQQLVDDCQAFQRASGPFGEELLKSDIFLALKAIAARAKSPHSNAGEQIMSVLSRKTISNAYVITDKDTGDHYYSKSEPVNSGSIFSFDYYTTTTGTQTTGKTLLGLKVTVPSSGKGDDWLSPQTRMYRRIAERIKAPEGGTYELLFTAAVAEVAEETTVDPLLRLFLVEELLKLGSSGSEPFRRRAEKILTGISAVGASRLTNWAAPGDERAKEERILADAFLKSRTDELLNELSLIPADMVRLRESALPPDLKWAGWMHRNSKSDWIVSLAPGLTSEPRHTSICIFYLPTLAGTTVTKFEIAKLEPAAKLSLSANPIPESPLEGRPVYLILD